MRRATTADSVRSGGVRAPLFPLALGVALGALPPPGYGLGAAVVLLLLSRGRRALVFPALAVLVGALGVFIGERWAAQRPDVPLGAWVGRVESVELAGPKPRLRLEPEATPWVQVRVVVDDLPPGLAVGARVRFHPEGKLRVPQPAEADGLFDAEAWTRTRRIAFTGRGAVEVVAPGSVWARSWLGLRRGAHAALDAAPSAEGAAVLRGLLLGDQTALPRAAVQAFEATGTGHLLSVSGLHISGLALVVFTVAQGLARRFGALEPRRAAALVALPAAWLFVALSEWPLAAVRSGVMTGGALLAIVLRRRAPPLNLLGLAALTVLFPDPTVAREPSFGLSFGAVLALVLLAEGRGPVSWVRASLAASAATAPLQAGFFGTLSPWAPVANLVLVPLASGVLVPLGILGLALVPLSAWPLAAVAELTALFTALVEETAGLLGGVAVVGAHAAGVLALPLVLWMGARWQVPRTTALLSLGLVALTLWRAPPARYVEFLPVGQGDAILLVCDDDAVLVDAGPDPAARVIRSRLRTLGVGTLRAVIVTHGHPDHAAGLGATLGEVETSTVFAPARTLPSLRRPAASARGAVSISDPGASAFRLGADCGLRFLDHAPPADASENDVSLVARFETPEGGLLLTGDIEAEAEARLVERHGQALRTSVLKAPHHGSRTSSTPGFLGAVAPAVVVFTTGRDNRWQFPREGIRARYQRRGIAEFDTGRQGLVRLVFEADGPRLMPFRDAGSVPGERRAGGNLIARNATPE